MNCFICAQDPPSGFLIPAQFRMVDDSWSDELVCAHCLLKAALEESDDEDLEKTRVSI